MVVVVVVVGNALLFFTLGRFGTTFAGICWRYLPLYSHSLFVLDICSDLYAMPRQLGTCVVRRRAKCMYCCTAVMYAYVRIYVAQQSPNDPPVKHHNT